MDVQRLDIEPRAPEAHAAEAVRPDPAAIDAVLARVLAAQRPLVLVGGGIRSARATEPLRTLVKLLGIPVVHSLMAVDVLPSNDELRVGMIGTYGNRWANVAMGNCDCLLVLGAAASTCGRRGPTRPRS